MDQQHQNIASIVHESLKLKDESPLTVGDLLKILALCPSFTKQPSSSSATTSTVSKKSGSSSKKKTNNTPTGSTNGGSEDMGPLYDHNADTCAKKLSSGINAGKRCTVKKSYTNPDGQQFCSKHKAADAVKIEAPVTATKASAASKKNGGGRVAPHNQFQKQAIEVMLDDFLKTEPPPQISSACSDDDEEEEDELTDKLSDLTVCHDDDDEQQ
jgi:hypothetical protein